jgi:hypothetical protein
MATVSRFYALFLAVAMALLIGCGGSGSGTGGVAPSALTRQQVRDGLGHTIMALAQSGAMPSAAVGTSGGSTGGYYAGVPFIGGYVRFSEPGMGAVGGSEGGSTGGTTGSGGGDEPAITLYFDEYLGLWAETTFTENSMTTQLFEDEAKTKPAGSFAVEYTAGSYVSTFEITAGTFAGAHGRYVTTFSEDFTSGETRYENTWPTWGSDHGTSTWGPTGTVWEHRSDATDGTWFETTGQFDAEGNGILTGSDSLGFRYRFEYRADGSGSGRVEGPLPGLPCTISWRADGYTRIVWANGEVEIFEPGDVIAGTSGGSGGSPPVTGTSGG